MEYYEICFYIELIGRNAIALAMLIVLLKRYKKMQLMGKGSEEVRRITPSSYILRFLLLLFNCIEMGIVISLYYSSQHLEQLLHFNFYAYSWTLSFLIAINALQLIVMRKEYRRQVSYMNIHSLYWFIDLILYTLLFFVEVWQVEQGQISLPVVRLVTKVLIFGFSFYKKNNSIRVIEKSFLSQATRYLVDLPSTTARSGMKVISTLNTQPDTGRTQIATPKKGSLHNLDQDREHRRIKIVVKYQFHFNIKGEMCYVLECNDYLKTGDRIIIKKSMHNFLQLQNDINSIKNPLNLTNFSYISSQLSNRQSPNNDNIPPQFNLNIQSDHGQPALNKDNFNQEDNSSSNNEELKIEDNAFKQILAIQKFIDYVIKEYYFEEVFLVKFLGLTRKQYYQEINTLQDEDCCYRNENEFLEFKQNYAKLKHTFSITPITKVSLQSLGNIRNDGVQYYQLTLRKQQVDSSLSLLSQSQPLRYTDFSNFYKQFQKEVFPIRLPDFPPKTILNDKETMFQRKQMLTKFLTIIYNENTYFSKSLFSFQNCFEDFMIQKAQNISNDLNQYAVLLQGKYLDSSKQFLFKIFSKRSSNRLFFIVKRFKDIINLHKDLELYYQNLLQYLVQQAYESFKQKQLALENDFSHNPQIQEERNILKEIKKTIKLPQKPKSINDCAAYLQEVIDCNLYHKSICFRQFLFGFEYLEEILNDNPNSSVCFSKSQSYEQDCNL